MLKLLVSKLLVPRVLVPKLCFGTPSREALLRARDELRERTRRSGASARVNDQEWALQRDVERIFLVGYRGTGKSTVARVLGERLGWAWIDADELLQQRQGRTIREVFAREGEAGFRDKESAILAELCERPRLVIATGGGVVLRPENRRLLQAKGLVVWLKADAGTIHARLQADPRSAEQRPPLTAGDERGEIEDLLAVREPLYRECADLAVDAGQGRPEDVVERIQHLLGELGDAGQSSS